MDDRGNIYTEEQRQRLREALGADGAQELERAARFVDIPEREVARVVAMNRHDRRAWHAQRRRALRAGRRAKP